MRGFERGTQRTYSSLILRTPESEKETFLTCRSLSLKTGPPAEVELGRKLAFDLPIKGYGDLLVDGMLSLPGTTAACRTAGEVASDLGSTRKEWRGNGQRRRQGENTATICTDVVLVGSELSTLSCDTLEILLSRSVCVANLKQKTLFANGLTMELLDDLVADITTLKTITHVSEAHREEIWNFSPSEANTSAVVLAIPEDSARLNSIVHEDSTKLLLKTSVLLTQSRTSKTNRFSHILGKV